MKVRVAAQINQDHERKSEVQAWGGEEGTLNGKMVKSDEPKAITGRLSK